MKLYRIDWERTQAGSTDVIAETAEQARHLYGIVRGDITVYTADEFQAACDALGDEDTETVDEHITGVHDDDTVTRVTYDWTDLERTALSGAFEAWAENQADDQHAGGGQTDEQLAYYDDLQRRIGFDHNVPLDAYDVELLRNAAWNALDTPDAFDDWLSMGDLRDAVVSAAWGDLLEGDTP